ncbi:farnesylcysteine lyase [Magnolia sinica]|uniref:farnesylcysteine lyase n=1 Tax=Magnolia sinica TaxID=86752 RepID=UPI00265A3718|nr:farnesylcysteine lyase [Magnolia sinica]
MEEPKLSFGGAIRLIFSLLILSSAAVSATSPSRICIIGSGIGGSSIAHFLKTYSNKHLNDIRIFERSGRVGGRMATVSISGDVFEAGASIIHPKNFHALNFTASLNLRTNSNDGDDSSSWFGIWDGARFLFKTLPPPSESKPSFYKKIVSLLNSLLVFRRYGFSLLRMQRFVDKTVDRFLLYYSDFESRPVFTTVEEMLKWAGLYGLTQNTLQEELTDARLSQELISELITVITRINYGQNVTISGLAGAVSMAGSDAGLWSVEGGNWQIANGLIRHSNASLHLHEEITSISYVEGYYELNSTKGNSYSCEVTVVATPLDELNINFSPSVSIPKRELQHTHATFVRGLLNPAYFGLNLASEIPDLVGTIESSEVQFSSISVLKKFSEEDKTYKVFSRAPMEDRLLDLIFSARKETVRINWAAYPHYKAPEDFAPFLLDGLHLYYINAFENAASTIETGAVAAENVARLILSRLPSGSPSNLPNLMRSAPHEESMHVDL